MYVMFTLTCIVGIGSGSRPIFHHQKFCIEQLQTDNALALANTLSNNPKVKDIEVMLKPSDDDETIYIGIDGCVQKNGHLDKNNETGSFIWALKAGMVMQRGRQAK